MTGTNSVTDTNTKIYFLIGFMGSGKSMLSRGVTDRIDAIAVEMDEEIESTADMSINDIFSSRGEEGFRNLEREVLHDLIRQYQNAGKIVLISTGGGVPCFFDNMEVMNRFGTTIFINPSVERLCARLESKHMDRPLIKDKNPAEIKEYIKSNLEKRLPFYKQAHIQINMVYDDKDLNIEFLKDIIQVEALPDVG